MPSKRTAAEILDFWTEFALDAYWKSLVEESIRLHLINEVTGLTEDSETCEN